MTAVESLATLTMTADKGDGTAVADLAMTDDCRVGHVSTVVSNPFQLIGYRVRGWQSLAFKAHLPKHDGKSFLVVGAKRGILPRTLVDVSWLLCNPAVWHSLVPGCLSPRWLDRLVVHAIILVRLWKTTHV